MVEMYRYEIHCHNIATQNDEVVEIGEHYDWADSYYECRADELQAQDSCAEHVYDVHREITS